MLRSPNVVSHLLQVERWARQYLASTGEGKSGRNPQMLELIDWLRQHIPAEDTSITTGGLVHGDFRIDNIVFHPIEVGVTSKFLLMFVSYLFLIFLHLYNAYQDYSSS